MIKTATKVLVWGFLLVAVSIYAFEFVASDYDTPHVTLWKWPLLLVAGLILLFTRNRDNDVLQHHLPH